MFVFVWQDKDSYFILKCIPFLWFLLIPIYNIYKAKYTLWGWRICSPFYLLHRSLKISVLRKNIKKKCNFF